MSIKKLLVITCILISSSILADHGWQRVNYMQSTIFTAAIHVSDSSAHVGDVLGAFVSGECRMIAPIFIHNDTSYVSSVIHGDKPDSVYFKLWLKNTDTIINIPQATILKPGGSILYYSINIP